MIKKIAAMIALCSLAWGKTRIENVPFLTPGYEEEKMQYILRDLETIETGSIDFIGDEKIGNDEMDDCDNSYMECYACVQAAFQERGATFSFRNEDYYPDVASIDTKLYFQGKAILVEVQLVGEACLKRSRVCIPSVIWKEQAFIYADSFLEAKPTIFFYIHAFTGKILDAHLEAKKNPNL